MSDSSFPERSQMRVLIGVTGASGSIYAERLIQELLPKVARIYVVITESGASVSQYELKRQTSGFSLLDLLQGKVPDAYKSVLRVFKNDDFFAPIASGSSAPTHMVVLPCSMGTLARIRHGLSQTLLERSADVVIKEGKSLILAVRETPFSVIHLENMLALAKMGIKIAPLVTSFYQHPKTIEDCIDSSVGKTLELMGLEHNLYKKWDERRL